MWKVFKESMLVFKDYLIIFAIFVFFSYPFFKHLQLFSVGVFLIMLLMIYSDLNSLAIKEKRPQYNLNPYPLKGLVMGLIGFLPIVIIVCIIPLIPTTNEYMNFDVLKSWIINALLGPMYFFIKLGNESLLVYIIACLTVPLICFVAYITGFYGFEIAKYFNKFAKKKPTKNKK